MTDSLLSHPYFGIVLSVAAYAAGSLIKAKARTPLANPLLIATAIIALLIECTPLTLEQYRSGGAVITLFILPATAALALQINRQWEALRANAIPVAGACVVGGAASMASVWTLCRVFGIDGVVMASLLPKSVTTAIAIDLSAGAGGIPSLTVSAVILTGMTSAILSPFLIRMFRLRNSVANGIAIGASGHAVGTARALEIGGTEGAFSGIALGLSGIATSVIYAVWM